MEPAMTTTAGIYCKQCGYDLRGSLEAGRCPECGRIFSPGDPKTFRTRPFPAPWKRALGRWAKRCAVLLLGLVLLLAGLWGWYYWGWSQEQAALAGWGSMVRLSTPAWPVDPLERWLWSRRVPGSFAFKRITWIRLDATATDADLLPLRRFSKLERLIVDGPITDAGLIHLAKPPALKYLVLRGTRVTDAGLVHLEKLPALQTLDLRDTKVTPAGVAKLKAALPRCTIVGP